MCQAILFSAGCLKLNSVGSNSIMLLLGLEILSYSASKEPSLLLAFAL